MVHAIRPVSSEFMNKQLEVEMEVGRSHVVRADNCGDRQEGDSRTITGFNGMYVHVVSIRICGSCP